MAVNTLEKTPWYKVGWVWYIIFMKFAVITACIITAILIYRNPISMVVDDYYTEGRSINLQLQKVAEAEARDLSFYLDIDDEQISLRFRTGEADDNTALALVFFHPTMHEFDFTLRLPRGADGVYRQQLPESISGHWRVDIQPLDDSWRVSQNIHLPANDTIVMFPVNYGI